MSPTTYIGRNFYLFGFWKELVGTSLSLLCVLCTVKKFRINKYRL